jgi:hypothetical protein
MRFVVYGSTDFTGCDVTGFQSACVEIGKAIATKKHIAIIGSDSEHTADRHIVLGMSQVAGKHTVIVDRPEHMTDSPDLHGDDELNDEERSQREEDKRAGKQISLTPKRIAKKRPFSDTTNYPNIDFQYRFREGSWYVTHFQATAKADCVIVIGGSDGTALAGLSASALRKPVVAIAAFGGAAEQVFKTVRQYYEVAGVSEDQSNKLRYWEEDTGNTVVTIAEQLVSNNPIAENNRTALRWFLAILTVLMVLWYALYSGTFGAFTPWKLGITIAISALLGSGLRTLTKLGSDPKLAFNPDEQLLTFVTSIIVAFTFVMFYLLGNIVYAGKPISFTNPSQAGKPLVSNDSNQAGQPDDSGSKNIQNAVLYVSLIGIASGFVLDKALTSLEQELTNRLNIRGR